MDAETKGALEGILTGARKQIGPLDIRRVLPAVERRAVGPCIFFDAFGPATLGPGEGMDIRPHPHINLATVTYLFAGAIRHQDSLGSDQLIEPGAINWMSAGRGIVHSERTPPHLRDRGHEVHGIQLWVGLPTEDEEGAPSFVHYPAAAIPELERDGARLRVLVGEAYGVASPVETLASMIYVEARLEAGSNLALPEGYSERAVYVVAGRVRCAGRELEVGQMAVAKAGRALSLDGLTDAHLMILGGEPLGRRHLWWNFASSSPERIEQAKQAWAGGPGNSERFGLVPGDEDEFIPLP